MTTFLKQLNIVHYTSVNCPEQTRPFIVRVKSKLLRHSTAKTSTQHCAIAHSISNESDNDGFHGTTKEPPENL